MVNALVSSRPRYKIDAPAEYGGKGFFAAQSYKFVVLR